MERRGVAATRRACYQAPYGDYLLSTAADVAVVAATAAANFT